MFKRILIATDGSLFSDKAAELAVSLAASVNAELVALNVEPRYESFLFSERVLDDIERALRKHSDDVLAKVVELAGKAAMPCKIQRVKHEAPFRAIIEAAEGSSSDLIVMGSHGRSGVQSLILGSVTQKVLAHTKLPVLVAP
jgi:nucleotide-binding universal stress UspA family protein